MYLPIQTSPVVFLFVLTDPNQDIFGVFRSQAVDAALRFNAGYSMFYHQTFFLPLTVTPFDGQTSQTIHVFDYTWGSLH